MPGITDLPNDFVLRFKVDGESTAGNADTWPLCVVDANAANGWLITGVRWIPGAAVAGAATNNFALQVQDLGTSGVGNAAVTTAKAYAAGVNSVAYVPETLPLAAANPAGPLVSDGDVLALVRTVNGTGLASPRGTLEVQYRYR